MLESSDYYLQYACYARYSFVLIVVVTSIIVIGNVILTSGECALRICINDEMKEAEVVR